MDPWLIQQLEERLAGLQDSDHVELNAFEDSDLSMYPAIKIPEINLSANQCELIANNLIEMIATGEEYLILQAARAMAALAYNALMDREGHHNHDNVIPFFHKYSIDEYTETWLRIGGISNVNLVALSHRQSQELDDQDKLALMLVNWRASEFERKCSIGVWAFSHLKALWGPEKGTVNFVGIRSLGGREMFLELYGFRCAYEFPQLSSDCLRQFKTACKWKQPGEMMYLLYRSAIMVEKIQRHPGMQGQKTLLVRLVFSGWDGLGYGGLKLWTIFQSASRKLHISETQLLDDLDWALKDPRWIKYSLSSLKTVELLREFRRKFEEGNQSRYYMYARVVNYYYFYYLGSKSTKELAAALRKLSSGWMELRDDSPYEKWGQLIAQKIQELRSLP